MTTQASQSGKRVFMTGNEAAAWAAINAKADAMFGYPITPQNEIMHYWTRLAPKYGRKFLQTEDEISAGFSTNGALMTGRKAFTATAGPGNILMQEPFGMAEAMRLPFVAVIQQRGGPSSGTVVYSQQEVTLTTYGGNGEGHRIVYSTCSHQEIYDYTIKAFNVAWKYRFPTYILGDGYQAKMREPFIMYTPEERGIELVEAQPFVGLPGEIGKDRQAQHLCNIYSLEEELYDAVLKIQADYDRIKPEIIEYKEFYTEDAEIVIIAHGIVARAAEEAVSMLRAKGVKAGLFRPITLRPFPRQALQQIAARASKMLVVESAYGQLMRIVREEIYGSATPIERIYRPGVMVIPDEIVDQVKEMV